MDRLKSSYQKTIEYVMETVNTNLEKILKNYSYNGNINDKDNISDIVNMTVENVIQNEAVVLNMTELLKFDNDTIDHSINVAIISVLIGFKQKLDMKSIEHLAIAGLLHDIGKAEIFKNNPKLGDRDYVYNVADKKLMQTHPVLAFENLKQNSDLSNSVLRAILLHHVWQKPDFSYDRNHKLYTSYPLYFDGKKIDGKKEKDELCEIIQVVDYFEVLSRKTGSVMQTLCTIQQMIGTRFGFSAEALVEFISPYSIGEHVELSDFSIGVVVEQTNVPQKPVVMVDRGKLRGKVINLLDSNISIVREIVVP